MCCASAEPQTLPEASQNVHIGPPAYQTEDGSFKLDLSCLIQHADLPQAMLDALRAIDIHSGQWPVNALQQATSLDKSQLLALQVMLA